MSEESPSPSESQRAAVQLKLFGRTDVGQVREHNEDNFLIADLTTKSRGLRQEDRERTVDRCGNLFAVCDGMGGAAAGEIASQMAVDLIYELMTSAEQPSSRDDLARNMVRAVEEAGLRIFNEARADRSRRGMGTTSTVAALIDERLFLAQVGDSRAYVLRGDQFVQVTRDQSLVNQLIEAGQLTEEEAETFEHNNIILQALGTSETVQVDLTYVDLREGDTLLMCSDGLSGMLRDTELKDVLEAVPEPMDACRELTERANAAGGHDNITVLVIKFTGAGLVAPSSKDDKLQFRRYALPTENMLASTSRHSRSSTPDVGPLSEEAQNERRALRVSHTMVGEALPELDGPRSGRPVAAELPDSEEPMHVPTTGLAPQLVGAIVVVSLLVVAAVGLFLLR